MVYTNGNGIYQQIANFIYEFVSLFDDIQWNCHWMIRIEKFP